MTQRSLMSNKTICQRKNYSPGKDSQPGLVRTSGFPLKHKIKIKHKIKNLIYQIASLSFIKAFQQFISPLPSEALYIGSRCHRIFKLHCLHTEINESIIIN